MELRQLRYFVVICEEGSLTRAAARLHVAQQSLSQVVAVLETELGVPLLERGSFGVRTTAGGRILHATASALLRDADAAARAVRQAAAVGSGHVVMRFGLDCEHLVEPLLTRIRSQLPHLAISGWTGPDSDNVHTVRAGEVDFALAWAVEGHAGDLHTLAVAEETCWAAVPDGHSLASLEAIPVQAMAGLPLVMFPRGAAPWAWDHIAGHFSAEGRLPPRITEAPVSGQAGLVAEAVATGAVAPVSLSLLPSLGRAGIQFRPFTPRLAVPLYLAWRTGLSAAGAAVVAAAENAVAAAPVDPGAAGTGQAEFVSRTR